MIDDKAELRRDTVVRHDDGLHYRIDRANRISTIDWERTHRLGGRIIEYTQLEDGEYPSGTEYAKDETGFRRHFTITSFPPPPENAIVDVLNEIRNQ